MCIRDRLRAFVGVSMRVLVGDQERGARDDVAVAVAYR